MPCCPNCKNDCASIDIYCAHCGARLVNNAGLSIQEPVSYINIEGNHINVTVSSPTEAKLALKQLKLKKKEFALLKRQITESERAIRAQYTDEVRRRGSKFQGSGGIGRFVRLVQTASRDAARHRLANQLAPFEQQKRSVEAIRAAIDEMILKVEEKILRDSF